MAAVEANSLLASPRFADSPTLTAAALSEFSRAETLDQAAVLRVAAELSAPGVGDGLVRLESAKADTVPSKTALREIADGGDWRVADTAAASATRVELTPLANKVLRPQAVRPAVVATDVSIAPRAARTSAAAAKTKAEATTPATTAAAKAAAPAPAKRRAAAPETAPGEKASTSPSGRRRKPAAGPKGK
jgi:murein DD-endopeptidase MepM/ murein hydrolase activator NlpD